MRYDYQPDYQPEAYVNADTTDLDLDLVQIALDEALYLLEDLLRTGGAQPASAAAARAAAQALVAALVDAQVGGLC